MKPRRGNVKMTSCKGNVRMRSCRGSHKGPEHGEDPGGPQDEQAAQGLGVVGLHHLDDPQQGLHPRPPQVPHVQALQVHQARPAASGAAADTSLSIWLPSKCDYV